MSDNDVSLDLLAIENQMQNKSIPNDRQTTQTLLSSCGVHLPEPSRHSPRVSSRKIDPLKFLYQHIDEGVQRLRMGSGSKKAKKDNTNTEHTEHQGFLCAFYSASERPEALGGWAAGAAEPVSRPVSLWKMLEFQELQEKCTHNPKQSKAGHATLPPIHLKTDHRAPSLPSSCWLYMFVVNDPTIPKDRKPTPPQSHISQTITHQSHDSARRLCHA